MKPQSTSSAFENTVQEAYTTTPGENEQAQKKDL